MFCCPHCSMLSTILFSIVTLDSGSRICHVLLYVLSWSRLSCIQFSGAVCHICVNNALPISLTLEKDFATFIFIFYLIDIHRALSYPRSEIAATN